MATTTFAQAQQVSTDAAFRAWIANVRAALAAIGLVQHTDTGQIDPATVAYPGSNSTAAGYEIWRFDDSLQATKPVFLKIEYGRGPFSGNIAMWLTVGSSTDGAGTINSALKSTRQVMYNSNAASASVFTSYISGNAARASFVAGGDNILFNVERSKDDNGADTGDAILVAAAGGSSQIEVSWVPYSGTLVERINAAWPVLTPMHGGSSGVEGANTALYPLLYTPVGPIKPPPRGLLFYMIADIAANTDIAVPLYGANHTYKTLNRAVSVAGGGSAGVAFLWE